MVAQWFNPAGPLWPDIRCKTEFYSDSGIMPQALIDAMASFKQEENMSEIMTCPVSRSMRQIKGQLSVENTQS
jgi:hypothetical protein